MDQAQVIGALRCLAVDWTDERIDELRRAEHYDTSDGRESVESIRAAGAWLQELQTDTGERVALFALQVQGDELAILALAGRASKRHNPIAAVHQACNSLAAALGVAGLRCVTNRPGMMIELGGLAWYTTGTIMRCKVQP